MRNITLRLDVQAALRDHNLRTTGRAMKATGIVSEPEVIARLERLAAPDEDLNDTIMRLLSGRASSTLN